MLWREHAVYRDRSGGVVIRADHVERWISLAPAGGRDEILLRVGRILDNGTTAPARSEAVVPLSAGTGELAATCRRLLADAAVDAVAPVAPRPTASGRTRRSGKPAPSGEPAPSKKAAQSGRGGRRMSFASWLIVICVSGVLALCVYSAAIGR
ncbi:hypothetical protein [Streptomyces sp. 8N706]|uniref:hypothetical protein n=1 Tax=Streptomyces sp. 8N706 TaxID=3457416 RepID=UPI003FD5467C